MLPSWLRRMVGSTRNKISLHSPKPQRRRRAPGLRFEHLEDRVTPTVYTVDSLLDASTGQGDSGTLRYVLNLANTNHTGTAEAPDLIEFATGSGTISVGADTAGAGLPALASNEVATIDATTATGYAGVPLITLDGTLATVGSPVNGMTISGGSSTIKGFDIIRFTGNGIQLDTNGGDTVLSCFIGITTASVAAANGLDGVFILSVSNNAIGSATAVGSADGLGANVISGNGLAGVHVFGTPAADASDNLIQGNFIGTNAAGNAAVGNGSDGVSIDNASNNTVGGSLAGGTGNIISGNQGNGVLIFHSSPNNTVAGNLIGTNKAGTAALGNALDGVRILNSDNNLIGHGDPVSSVSYFGTDQISTQPVNELTGIRGGDLPNQYLISGISGPLSSASGLFVRGTIEGVGQSFLVNFPNSATTSVYGPDNQGQGKIGLVGSYTKVGSTTVNGFIFQGLTDDLSNPAKYVTIDEPGADYTIVHSTMQGLAVGNYDSAADHGMGGLPLGPGHAFLYDVAKQKFLTDIVFPGSKSNTAYGIWYNGNGKYTICGGWSPDIVNNFPNQDQPIGQAYLVDYDSTTSKFSNFTSFSYPFGDNFLTHFEGISGVEKGVYTLSADSVQAGTINPAQGSYVTVRRNTNGSFDAGVWLNLNNPSQGTGGVTSANSVYANQVVGVVFPKDTPTFAFLATVNIEFQLSNVISGNGGNGVQISGAHANNVAMNYIGTDLTGTIDLGNTGNGILITSAATNNLIGGEATAANDPTNGVFAVPPQGNLISGNDANGVLINGLSTDNQLSGNFIGTTFTGDAPLGNTLDGVGIDNSDGNMLLGCLFQEDPFVFYNVVSGNGGNGVRATNSDNVVIQANFFGLGANNSTPVGNALDGVLINGSSANTQFGGVIPLGNVVAGNHTNGVEIADTASAGIYFNTFSGLPAFVDVAVPNTLDGFLISSTGGNNTLRTCVSSGNLGNGVHITGDASGVSIDEVIIGMNTDGTTFLPNSLNGVLIDGTAHGNFVGGEDPSIIPRNIISNNGANGVAIVEQAHDNQIFNNYIGTNVKGNAAFGNTLNGIFIGGTVKGTIIGGTDVTQHNLISGNLGSGINLSGSSEGTSVIGNLIGTDATGLQPIGNQGPGITITSSKNQVGGSATGDTNTIVFNAQGVTVNTGTSNGIHENSIFSNTGLGIQLLNNGNLNQPAPVLTGAIVITEGGIQTGVRISGTLKAQPNTTYLIELYATATGAPAGQGQSFLQSLSVITNASGAATFVVTTQASAGNTFTATATNSTNNNTSPFSAAIPLAGTANSVFIASVYGLLLSRLPDSGAAFWVNGLNSGTFTPVTAVLGIEGSQEYITDQVDAYYLRYLDRAADPQGQQYWVSFVQTGGTYEQVAEGMVSSTEYFQDNGSTNQGYVTGLYHDVLNRTPTPAEVNGWVTLLNAGTSRNAVAVFFLNSTEYRTELIDSYYMTFLNRQVDPGGLAAWLTAFGLGATDQQVLASIFGSPEGYAIWS